ncbi:MAG: polymer-forming cytoskeletal protein [Alphaproteobacteria bacterium]|nr:polymer-forming cytoskeletal protein [Alphaproteobacteria bacterium]
MFSKTENGSSAPSGLPSIISKDMTITGNIASPGTVQVEGTVNGDIECHELTLGETGEVKGHVKCDLADIHGTVIGELEVTNLTITASAKIHGDMVHENISIEAQARVEGQLVRRDTQQTNLNLVSGESI